MKVLYVVNDLKIGGAENIVIALACQMASMATVELLTLSDRDSSIINNEKIEATNIKHTSLSSGTLRSPTLIFKLLKFLRKNDFDVIHVHLFPALYFMAIVSPFIRAKLVFTEHSSSNNRIGKSMFRLFEKIVYSRYKLIVAITPKVQNILKKWLGNALKTRVIYNGIDLDNINSLQPHDLRQRYQLLDTDKLLLMTGRFDYPKRHDLLLQTLEILPLDYKLFLLGDGSKINYYKDLVQSSNIRDRVYFLGTSAEPCRYMKAVDLNILLSDYEGFSTVTLEALACGRPFLGSNVDGIKEFFISSGSQNLVDNEGANLIAQRIISVFKMRAEKISVDQYSLQNMRNNYFDVYAQVIT